MPLYDLMLLVDPGVPSDRHDAILGEVKKLLSSSGEIVTDQEWGTRRMTFEIDHRPEADYHLFQFQTENGGADLLDRVDHSLKIMDGVLRHRIIRLKDGTPPPTPPRPEGRYADAPPLSEQVSEAEYAAAAAAAAERHSVEAAPVETGGVDAAPVEPAPVETAAPDASSLPAEAEPAPTEATEVPAADETAAAGENAEPGEPSAA